MLSAPCDFPRAAGGLWRRGAGPTFFEVVPPTGRALFAHHALEVLLGLGPGHRLGIGAAGRSGGCHRRAILAQLLLAAGHRQHRDDDDQPHQHRAGDDVFDRRVAHARDAAADLGQQHRGAATGHRRRDHARPTGRRRREAGRTLGPGGRRRHRHRDEIQTFQAAAAAGKRPGRRAVRSRATGQRQAHREIGERRKRRGHGRVAARRRVPRRCLGRQQGGVERGDLGSSRRALPARRSGRRRPRPRPHHRAHRRSCGQTPPASKRNCGRFHRAGAGERVRQPASEDGGPREATAACWPRPARASRRRPRASSSVPSSRRGARSRRRPRSPRPAARMRVTSAASPSGPSCRPLMAMCHSTDARRVQPRGRRRRRPAVDPPRSPPPRRGW